MYKTINGWTKERMKAQIRAGNNGSRAVEDEFCRYLTRDGNRCAAGCFIPDGHVAQNDGGSAESLISDYADLRSRFPLDEYAFVKLQRVHDRYNGNEDMRTVLCDWIDKNVEDGV